MPPYQAPIAGNRIEPVSYVAELGSQTAIILVVRPPGFEFPNRSQGDFPGRQRSAKPMIGRLIS